MLLLVVFVYLVRIIHALDNVGSYGKLEFGNVGYDGMRRVIGKVSNSTNENCQCSLTEPTWFSGPNAPLSERLVAHIRGPIKLYKFAFYNVPSFIIGSDNNTQNWTQQAIFDISPGDEYKDIFNVTFMGHRGEDSPCQGRELTFLKQDAVTHSNENPDPRGFVAEIGSGEEFIIFSNFPCPRSGVGQTCGVYRKGIRSNTGFEGQTKLFLFEFTMPPETNTSRKSMRHYDAPAIWVANDRLSRGTEFYHVDNNCSCLYNGCGAYQVFTVNETDTNYMYSALQTFQPTEDGNIVDDVFKGITSNGQFPRPLNTTVRGGVLFDSVGNVVTFLTNRTEFNYVITPEELEDLLYDIPVIGTERILQKGSLVAPNTTKSNIGSTFRAVNSFRLICFSLLTTFIQAFML